MGNIKDYEPLWGSWKVEKKLGQGTFGSVYLVTNKRRNRVYKAAVKIMSIPQNDSEIRQQRRRGMSDEAIRSFYEKKVDRLEQEIDLMEELKSASNIVTIEDYMIEPRLDENGNEAIGYDVLIRMEYLQNVDDYMIENEPDEKEVIKMAIDICKALEHCEKKNIIHRDIKPDNLFRNEFGEYKLGDFGISRQMDHTTNATSAGTPLYMAPEILRYEKYNHTVDIYSVGLMMYQMMNHNRLPFFPEYPEEVWPEDSEYAMQERLSGQPLPKIKGIREELWTIIVKATAFKAADRYKKASEMRHALEYMVLNKKQTPDRKEEEPLDEYIIKPEPGATMLGTNPTPVKKEKEQKVLNSSSYIKEEKRLQKVYETGWDGKREMEVEPDPKKAFEHCKNAADAGDAEALFDLAQKYRNGWGVKQNWSKTTYFLEQAGKAGYGKAYHSLAGIYKAGILVDKDFKQEEEYCKKGIALKDTSSMLYLANRYESIGGYTEEVGRLRKLALETMKKKAEKGDANEIYRLASQYLIGSKLVSKDVETGKKYLQRAVDLGNADAMSRMAGNYYYGFEEYPEDRKKSLDLYRQSIKAGKGDARFHIALAYQYGASGIVKIDREKAAEEFRKAALCGSSYSWVSLAKLYKTENKKRMIQYYQEAMNANNIAAYYEMGKCYEEGDGVAKDMSKAFSLYEQAVSLTFAEYKEFDALYRIASSYESGDYYPMDKKKALELYQECAELRSYDIKAKDKIEALKKELGYGQGNKVKPARPVKKDKNDPNAALKNRIRAALQKGNKINFGHYKQTANGSEAPIAWKVLKQQGNRLLLISEDCLDAKKFHDTYSYVTWETCSLRQWLNKDFMETAFTVSERKMICSTSLKASACDKSAQAGNDTVDKVFCLSAEEANAFFKNNEERQFKITDYAKENGAYAGGGWFLRSIGQDNMRVGIVFKDGSIFNFGSRIDLIYDSVRPAMWIDLDA